MQEEIIRRVQTTITDAQVKVEVDGNRALIEVESAVFADLTRVKRQQTVYACIEDLISSGALHAVTIKTDVPVA